MVVNNYSAILTGNQNPLNVTQRSASFGNNRQNSWIAEPQLSWKAGLGKGKLELLAGTSFQESITDGENLYGTGYSSDALLENIGSASLISVSSRQFLQYHYAAVYARANYALKDKYIINLTGRRDGSTRFGNEKRFANFGAVGGAWILSEEQFLKNSPIVSFAKLRASYGITGNDQIKDYGYLALWSNQTSGAATYQGLTTIMPNGLANPEYSWETNKKLEFALEGALLKDRLNFSAGFYSNRSSNQLLDSQLPPSVGFTSIQDNLPATVSNTGWEFTLSTKNISNKQFQWTSSVNLTIPKNKLVSYPNLSSSGYNATIYEVGQPLSIVKVYNSYLNSNTGLYEVEDYDKNNVIDDRDKYVLEFVGRKFYGGLQNNFTYKGFELDFLVQFVKQKGQNRSQSLPGYFSSSSSSNQRIELLDRWQMPGQVRDFQQFSTSIEAESSQFNGVFLGTLGIEDISFIRLKNVALSYNISDKLTRLLKISGAKFYLQGQNVFTVTKYNGLDPETQGFSTLPALQVFTAGIQLTF